MPEPDRPRPSRRTLTLIVTPIVIVVAFGYAGQAFFPTLLDRHPLALVAMEPRNRNIILVAGEVAFWPLLIVATLRRLATDPLFYLLGRLYGDAGVRWAEKKLGDAGVIVTTLERWFAKAGPLLVMLAPGLYVCVLAGAAGMHPVLFFALNILGTVAMVSLMYWFSDRIDPVISPVTEFIQRYALPLTVVSFALTAVWLMDQRRRGRSELETVDEFEAELEAAAEEVRSTDDG